MTLAKIVFYVAAGYGVLSLVPSLFLENLIGRTAPPPITHPEYFYGFLGIALAWQTVFLAIALNPRRYRPMMLLAILEKIGFGVPVITLYALQRVPLPTLVAGCFDLLLGALFLLAYARTPRAP